MTIPKRNFCLLLRKTISKICFIVFMQFSKAVARYNYALVYILCFYVFQSIFFATIYN